MLLSPVLFSSHLPSYTHITWFTQHSTSIISLRLQLMEGPQSPQRKVAVSSLSVNEGKTKIVKMERERQNVSREPQVQVGSSMFCKT
jgi:hypothetical protein